MSLIQATPVRPKDHTNASPADADRFIFDGDDGVRSMLFSALRTTLVGGITGGLVFRGTVAGASVPATSSAVGDYYVISTGGTSQSKTWTVGDMAIYRGPSGTWDRIPSARSVLNVTDYGALGNGVTDDTAAFTLTIAAASAKAIIVVPAGTFPLTSVVVNKDVSFQCATNATLFHIAGATNHMIRYTAACTGHFESGILDGNKANQDVDANFFSLVSSYSDGMQFRNVRFQNFMDGAIEDIQTLGNISMLRCQFLNGYSLAESATKANAAVQFAPGLAGGAPHIWIEGCVMLNSADPSAGFKACGGFYVAGSDGFASLNSLTFKDNYLKRVGDDHVPGPGPNHYGIAALDLYEDTVNATITGNYIETYYAGAKLQNVKNLTFSNNVIKTTGLVGIDYCPGERLQTAEYSNAKITGNTVEVSTAAVGIYIRAGDSGGWHEVLIDGNTIKECLKSIVINGLVGLTSVNEGYGPIIVTNNFLWNSGANAIEILHTQADIAIKNNYINVTGGSGVTALSGNADTTLKVEGNTVIVNTTGLRALRVWGVKELTVTDNLFAAADAGSIAVEIDEDAATPTPNKVQKLIYRDNIIRTGTKSIDQTGVVVYIQDFRVVANDATVAANVGTAETDLAELTIPANTLNENGETLEFEGAGLLSASGTNKTLRIYFGGVQLFTSLAMPAAALASYRFRGTITRASSTAENCIVELLTETTVGERLKYTTQALDLTTSLTLKVTGQGGATNDIYLGFLKVKKVGLP